MSTYYYISNGHKNEVNATFSVQSKILHKLKGQISHIRYQNVQKSSGFTIEKHFLETLNLSSYVFISQKLTIFRFLKHKLCVFTILLIK